MTRRRRVGRGRRCLHTETPQEGRIRAHATHTQGVCPRDSGAQGVPACSFLWWVVWASSPRRDELKGAVPPPPPIHPTQTNHTTPTHLTHPYVYTGTKTSSPSTQNAGGGEEKPQTFAAAAGARGGGGAHPLSTHGAVQQEQPTTHLPPQ